MSDYRENILKIMDRQAHKGMDKYGATLEDNWTLTAAQRIEHLEEELIDGLQYCEHIKAALGPDKRADDFQRAVMRTAGEYATELDMIRNACYGLNGEAGEVIDLLKKHEFQGHDLNKDKMVEELGDVLWYAALLSTALGVRLSEVMQKNIDKLYQRYPEGFDKSRSINR